MVGPRAFDEKDLWIFSKKFQKCISLMQMAWKKGKMEDWAVRFEVRMSMEAYLDLHPHFEEIGLRMSCYIKAVSSESLFSFSILQLHGYILAAEQLRLAAPEKTARNYLWRKVGSYENPAHLDNIRGLTFLIKNLTARPYFGLSISHLKKCFKIPGLMTAFGRQLVDRDAWVNGHRSLVAFFHRDPSTDQMEMMVDAYATMPTESQAKSIISSFLKYVWSQKPASLSLLPGVEATEDDVVLADGRRLSSFDLFSRQHMELVLQNPTFVEIQGRMKPMEKRYEDYFGLSSIDRAEYLKLYRNLCRKNPHLESAVKASFLDIEVLPFYTSGQRFRPWATPVKFVLNTFDEGLDPSEWTTPTNRVED